MIIFLSRKFFIFRFLVFIHHLHILGNICMSRAGSEAKPSNMDLRPLILSIKIGFWIINVPLHKMCLGFKTSKTWFVFFFFIFLTELKIKGLISLITILTQLIKNIADSNNKKYSHGLNKSNNKEYSYELNTSNYISFKIFSFFQFISWQKIDVNFSSIP